MTTTETNFLIREPAEEYHAKASEYLSSHQLADFRRCPLLYRQKKLGLIPDEDRPAYVVGRALHTLVLEGRDRFEQEYAVGGPVNPRTGQIYGANTKAYAEWAAAQGKAVLTLAQFDLVENMADGVRANGMAVDLLSEGIPEGVVRAEYCGVPVQARFDSLPDMTSTSTSVTVAATDPSDGDSENLVGPLADLARRLRIEMQHGRDAVRQRASIPPGVTAAARAAYRSRPHKN